MSTYLKAIVFFTNVTRDNSEEYVYHNIESVKVTIKGVPNSMYSQGIPKSRFYEKAKMVFGEKTEFDQYMITWTFHNGSFSLVIDLRSIEDRSEVGSGRKIVNNQSRVLVEVK